MTASEEQGQPGSTRRRLAPGSSSSLSANAASLTGFALLKPKANFLFAEPLAAGASEKFMLYIPAHFMPNDVEVAHMHASWGMWYDAACEGCHRANFTIGLLFAGAIIVPTQREAICVQRGASSSLEHCRQQAILCRAKTSEITSPSPNSRA